MKLFDVGPEVAFDPEKLDQALQMSQRLADIEQEMKEAICAGDLLTAFHRACSLTNLDPAEAIANLSRHPKRPLYRRLLRYRTP